MNDYIYIFLKEYLDTKALTAFCSTFRGRQYIPDFRYEIREQKIKSLWNDYKELRHLNKKEKFKKIADEVDEILPTKPRHVKYVVDGC